MTLTLEAQDMQQRVSEVFETTDTERIAYFVQELMDYGIDNEDQLDEAYYGCYRNESEFCEDLLTDTYSEAIDAMPTFLQTAIDWELVWHQSMQYDFFTIYDRDSCEYYFFNRHF